MYLCRHAQAEHNVSKDYNLPDPVLSPHGRDQASTQIAPQLAAQSGERPPHPSLQLLVSSPFRRCLQTTQLALRDVYAAGRPVTVCTLFQECARKPCDTGSPLQVVREQYAALPADWAEVEQVEAECRATGHGWYEKVGVYDPSPAALQDRAALARAWLWQRRETAILVMTHHGFLQQLVGARPWDNAELHRCTLRPTVPLTGRESSLELGRKLAFLVPPAPPGKSPDPTGKMEERERASLSK